MNNPIKFIYFDVGGVIIRSSFMKKLSQDEGFPYARIGEIYKKYALKVCKGSMSAQELWVHYKEEIGIKKESKIMQSVGQMMQNQLKKCMLS